MSENSKIEISQRVWDITKEIDLTLRPCCTACGAPPAIMGRDLIDRMNHLIQSAINEAIAEAGK